MKVLILLLLPHFSLALSTQPTPLPIFLKQGFSSVLEFEEQPSKVVLGDSQSFQIEKLDHSLIVKTLAPYATTNMFVYFKSSSTKMFVLTASEDADPTYYKKIEDLKAPIAKATTARNLSNERTRITSAKFDPKKDYLTVEVSLSANEFVLAPNWKLVRLTYKNSAVTPFKLWAERKEVQRDSNVKARFVFVKPNVPRDLKNVGLVIPIKGQAKAVSLSLTGGA